MTINRENQPQQDTSSILLTAQLQKLNVEELQGIVGGISAEISADEIVTLGEAGVEAAEFAYNNL